MPDAVGASSDGVAEGRAPIRGRPEPLDTLPPHPPDPTEPPPPPPPPPPATHAAATPPNLLEPDALPIDASLPDGARVPIKAPADPGPPDSPSPPPAAVPVELPTTQARGAAPSSQSPTVIDYNDLDESDANDRSDLLHRNALFDVKNTPEQEAEPPALSGELVVYHIRKMILRKQVQTGLPWFAFYLLVTIISLLIYSLHLSDGTPFYQTQGIDFDLDTENFYKIQDSPKFWEWMKAVPGIWEVPTGATPQGPNIPVGYLILRQFRVKEQAANASAMELLPSSVRNYMRPTMHPPFSLPDVEYAPFGTAAPGNAMLNDNAPPWFPNWKSPKFHANGVITNGKLADYTDPKYAYSIYLDYKEDPAVVVAQIAQLEKLKWIDGATRAVMVDVLMFNADPKMFVVTTFLLEFSAEGILLPSVSHAPFQVHVKTNSKFALLLGLDIASLVSAAGEFFLLFRTVWVTAKKSHNWSEPFGFWFLLHIAWVVILARYSVEKVKVWFPLFNSTTKMELMNDMCTYAVWHRRAYVYLAILNMVTSIRVFGFLQSIGGTGVLAETIRRSSGYLVAWLATFIIIFFPFTIAGHILYGNALRDYNSLMSSALTLFFMISRGTVDNYLEMDSMYPLWTPVFFVTYLTLEWLIMLNMFIAIITGTFAVVQQAQQATSGGAASKKLSNIPARILSALSAFAMRLRQCGRRKVRRRGRRTGGKAGSPRGGRTNANLDGSLDATGRWMHRLGTAVNMGSNPLMSGSQSKRGNGDDADDDVDDDQSATEDQQYSAINAVRDLSMDDEGKCGLDTVQFTQEECYAAVKGYLPRRDVDKIYDRVAREEEASSSMKVVSERWTITTEKKVEYCFPRMQKLGQLEARLRGTTVIQRSMEQAVQRHGQSILASLNTILDQLEKVQPHVRTTQVGLAHVRSAHAIARTIVEAEGDNVPLADQVLREYADMEYVIPFCDYTAKLERLEKLVATHRAKFDKVRKYEMWGLTPHEYERQTPQIIDSAPGRGIVSRVERAALPQVVGGSGVDPHDPYTRWLSTQLGDDVLPDLRQSAVESELDKLFEADV